MSYHLSSKAFEDPALPELLKRLGTYFQRHEIPFYVVGAAARDIVLGMIHNRKARRKTNDLDVAIMIRDWAIFEKVSEDFSNSTDFIKSSRQKQRWHYKDHLILDMIPFGEIARSDRKIYWPPDETPVMSVSGFTAMAKKALTIILDKELLVGVASLPGLFVLKLAAWKDRHLVNNKDADDIAGLLDEYLDINTERAAVEHRDIFERRDFTTFLAGAILMARDVRALLADDPSLRVEVCRMLLEEIDQKEQSLLIQQILETHRLKKYEEVLKGLALMESELRK